MTYFIRRGNTFSPTDEANLDIHRLLPAGNYVVKVVPMSGEMYLETVDSFTFTSKRYGDNVRHTNRIIGTFMDRPSSTGVILAGEKGSGKSLLAKTVSMEAAKLGIPTIIINYAFHGDSFNAFIQGIDQPAIILFDEFEKVYDRDEQEAVLTLLDGVFPSKKLFVITCNDKWRIDSHMRNRPGRIYYMLDFVGLSAEFITEYCNDNLNNKSHIEKICTIASVFGQFNFDILKALVEEMNRYDESPEQALEWLNSRPEYDENLSMFDATLSIGGIVVKLIHGTDVLKLNPLRFDTEVYHDGVDNVQDAADPHGPFDDNGSPQSMSASDSCQKFSSSDIVKVDADAGKFTYRNKHDNILTLVRQAQKSIRYFDAL